MRKTLFRRPVENIGRIEDIAITSWARVLLDVSAVHCRLTVAVRELCVGEHAEADVKVAEGSSRGRPPLVAEALAAVWRTHQLREVTAGWAAKAPKALVLICRRRVSHQGVKNANRSCSPGLFVAVQLRYICWSLRYCALIGLRVVLSAPLRRA